LSWWKVHQQLYEFEPRLLELQDILKMLEILKSLVITFRPWQWVKNVFVLAPLVFSNQLLSLSMDLKFLAGFFIFSLLSSAVYGINDLADLEKDRKHPFKMGRPLASGAIKPTVVIVAVLITLFVILPLAFIIGKKFFLISLMYLALNLLYSFVFKRFAVVDAISLSLGFVLRVWAGSAIAEVEPTGWIMLTTFFLALFLAFCKRRQELLIIDKSEIGPTSALTQYNMSFLDGVIILAATCAIMCFSLFTLSDYALHKFNSKYLALSVPCVVLGILRYLHLTHFQNKGKDPTMTLLTDLPLQISILLWFLGMIGIIYFSHK
jgi:4-hydroxybenzoate polyprenyltransferase